MQGYIQYRYSGEPHRLDVDTLNEQLQIKGAARMRTSMKPDEAFGMIFDLEGVYPCRTGNCRSLWYEVVSSNKLCVNADVQE